MFIILRRSALISVLLISLILTLSFSIKDRAISIASAKISGKDIPILMYHHILPQKEQLGTYTVSPSEFESDIIHLISLGYTSISIKELLDYTENGAKLPEKPFIITVDDGYLSFFDYAFPILKRYNCKAVLSIIGKPTEEYSEKDERNAIYTHVTFDDIREMLESGLVEIANHSYNMHDLTKRHGIKKKNGETKEQYESVLKNDILMTQNILTEKTKYTPYIYTYPFGYYNEESKEIIKNLGFKASFICEERVNRVSKGSTLFNLYRFNRVHGIDFRKFWNKIEQKMRK